MLFKASELDSVRDLPTESEYPLLPDNLLIPLTNILIEWSVQND